MSTARFADREERLATEGREKYRGTARVWLKVLHFPRDASRELNRGNVEHLKKRFAKGHCDRVMRNHIPAVIHQTQLDEVLRASKISVKSLLSNTDPHPFLEFPAGFQLHCLHGQHRIQAAREVLVPRDSWWTVDLYLTDADHELKTALIEEYANEKPPSAGEIYCKVRQYRAERNLYSENRWLSHLSEHEARCLKELFHHSEFTKAFDELLVIPGLWAGMRISTLNKMISMKCDEEVLAYLAHIKTVWSTLLRGEEEAMQIVDNATVKALELMAPRHSKLDAQKLHGQLVSGQIFAAFTAHDRETIWSGLRSVPGLIPSLFTFFADVNYLQACAGSMRHLVAPDLRYTIRTALDQAFRGGAARWDSSYRQLWLYAMQNHPHLPAPPKKHESMEKRLAKTEPAKPDEVVLSEFAALADRLGFQSDPISALKQRSPDREIARSALLHARKPDCYEYTDHALESHIEQIARLFATATPLLAERSCPAFVSDDPKAPGIRCGFPNKKAHAQDAKSLSIDNLHVDVEEQGKSITSFFVRRYVYLTFFGRPGETGRERHGDSGQEQVTLGGERSASGQESLARAEQRNREEEEIPNKQGEGDPSQSTERDERRGTQAGIERIIANGLARIPEDAEDRPQSTQATMDLGELVASYQDLIGTDGATDDGQLNAGGQLQTMSPPPATRIEFMIKERDVWRIDRSLLVDPSDPSEVERVAKKYMRKGIRPFDSSYHLLLPGTCFQAATADGSNTILLIPEDRAEISNQLVKFAPDAMAEREFRKRARQKRGRQ